MGVLSWEAGAPIDHSSSWQHGRVMTESQFYSQYYLGYLNDLRSSLAVNSDIPAP